HNGDARSISHGTLKAGMEHHEKVAIHPFAVFLNGDLAAGTHLGGFHIALRSPVADEVADLLNLRSGLRRSLRKGTSDADNTYEQDSKKLHIALSTKVWREEHARQPMVEVRASHVNL